MVIGHPAGYRGNRSGNFHCFVIGYITIKAGNLVLGWIFDAINTTSITTAPGLIQSPFNQFPHVQPLRPRDIASFNFSFRFFVREWQIVTVALARTSNSATLACNNYWIAPKTTAINTFQLGGLLFPTDTSHQQGVSIRGEQGLRGFLCQTPEILRGWKPSTSFQYDGRLERSLHLNRLGRAEVELKFH